MQTKTQEEIKIMKEGGKKLAQIKEKLKQKVIVGAIPFELDKEAEIMVRKAGGEPSFKMVKGYHWTTCINTNEGVVHGIPGKVAFKVGDIVSVDIGMYYKGFHTDTSFTTPVGEIDKETEKFLTVGREALSKSIKSAKPGNRISDISSAMQETIQKYGYSSVRALTGHGIGRKLHENPAIPCFWDGDRLLGEEIPIGAVLAIEVIYTMGKPDLVISNDDNWTIYTKDGKISSLFEETVAVGREGSFVLTA